MSALDFLDGDVISAIARSGPASMRVNLAREAAEAQDLRTLKLMASEGCFEFIPSMLASGDQADHTGQTRYAAEEIPLVAAWASIIEASSPVSVPYEHATGAAGDGIKRGRLMEPVSDEFKSEFERAIKEFWAGAQRHLEKHVGKSRPALPMPIWDTMLVLGAAAMAMDHVPSVQAVVEAIQWMKSHTQYDELPSQSRLKPTILGLNLELTRKVKFGAEHDHFRHYPVRISPWVLGIEFDSQAAWEFVVQATVRNSIVLESAQYLSKPKDGHGISAPELIAEGWMGSTPDGWRRMMANLSVKSATSDCAAAVSKLTVAALNPSLEPIWLDAALESGMQKMDPRTAVKSACLRSNNTDILHRLRKDIPWSEDPQVGHILFQIIPRAKLRRAKSASVLPTLLQFAFEDGHWESMLSARKPNVNQLGTPGESVVEHMAHHGCTDGLLAVFERGYDPRHSGSSAKNLLEHIEATIKSTEGSSQPAGMQATPQSDRHESERFVRSWVARLEATEAIAAMDHSCQP